MIGLLRGENKIIDYSDTWSEYFDEEHKKIFDITKGFEVQIEHIGGTSIQGCASKPIIDIALGVKDITQVDEIICMVKKLGYGDSWIHVLPDRTCLTKGQPYVTTHLYLTDGFSDTMEKWMFFRDYLRKNPEIIVVYSELKRKIAEKHPSGRLIYTKKKTDFIMEVLEKRHWHGKN